MGEVKAMDKGRAKMISWDRIDVGRRQRIRCDMVEVRRGQSRSKTRQDADRIVQARLRDIGRSNKQIRGDQDAE